MLPGPILYYGPGFFIWALLAASSRPCRKKGGADCLGGETGSKEKRRHRGGKNDETICFS